MFLKGSIHIPGHYLDGPGCIKQIRALRSQWALYLTWIIIIVISQKFRLCGGREAKLLKMPLQMSCKGVQGTDASPEPQLGRMGHWQQGESLNWFGRHRTDSCASAVGHGTGWSPAEPPALHPVCVPMALGTVTNRTHTGPEGQWAQPKKQHC